MQNSAQLDAIDADDLEPDMFEPEVHEMVRRLAAQLDDAIDADGDSRLVVAEALMRLSLGVYLYTAGPEATRDRLLAMALRAHPSDVVH
jgi:hypothetical protein